MHAANPASKLTNPPRARAILVRRLMFLDRHACCRSSCRRSPFSSRRPAPHRWLTAWPTCSTVPGATGRPSSTTGWPAGLEPDHGRPARGQHAGGRWRDGSGERHARRLPVARCGVVPVLQFSPDEAIETRFAAEAEWLRRCHAGGALITAACTGAMLLAGAGLLDGEDATTHWASATRCKAATARARATAALARGVWVKASAW